MRWSRQYQEPEAQRVNRWLAQSGVCSRREAEDLIARGLVSIDGQQVADPGHKIQPGQTLILQDEAGAAAPFTAVMNKPVGYVSGQPEHGQIPAARLLLRANLIGDSPLHPASDDSLPPLGRLDLDSRGLLLLSNDGVLAKAVIGPESKLEKVYLVQVQGALTGARVERLRHGLSLDGRALKPAGVTVVAAQTLQFVLREGRKRQIRRMCELVDLRVSDLVRLRIGPLALGDLPEGRWRALSPTEREALITASK